MNQKGIAPLIIVAIIVVAAVAVVGVVYVATRGEGGAPGGAGGDIETATSLDFKVETTQEGQTYTARFRAKNIGSQNIKFRIEGTTAGEQTPLRGKSSSD